MVWDGDAMIASAVITVFSPQDPMVVIRGERHG
jgi:hypothetical protein